MKGCHSLLRIAWMIIPNWLIFKSKANEVTVYTTVDQCPNVWLPYAPEYVEKPLRERHVALFSKYSGAYGSHTLGHSVGPLVLTPFIDK